MRLLFISAAFPPMRAGESEHAYHQCSHLARQGVDVHLLTSRSNAGTLEAPFTIHPVMRDWSWTDLPRLVQFLRSNKPDAVMLMYSGWIYNAHPMITFAPSIVKRIFPGIPFVTQMEIEEGESWRSPVVRAARKAAQFLVGPAGVDYSFGTLLRDSSRIICLSERHQATHAGKLAGVMEKSVVIPPPPLLPMCSDGPVMARERGRAALGLGPEDLLLVFFGYVDKNKGIETLFQAVQIVTKDARHVTLAMIGGGRGSTTQGEDDRAQSISQYELGIHALPEKLGIADHVRWLTGYQSDSDMASMYLYAADACVLPFDQGVTMSRSSLAAALAHGIPVITTKGEALETPFRDGENVLLCSPKDPEALAKLIAAVRSSPELCRTLRRGAMQLAQEWFSWDTAIARILKTMQ
ncbi:MAG: glycosyltransferase family 4 protein [Nitrospira sp.]|nr:glycosyltransferase family 4 protein [Nitrospira sp.]